MSGWTGLSASGVGAAIICPSRLVLPAAHTSSDAAARGDSLHEFARICGKTPEARDEALKAVPDDWKFTAEGMNIQQALEGLTIVGFERAYALNVKTGVVRFIGEDIGRDYNGTLAKNGQAPLDKYDVPFTIDVEGRSNFLNMPTELDYKSGQNVGDPAEHWQRRICATGLMLYYDEPTAISRIAYIWMDGSIHPDGCEFSILDTEEFLETCVRTIDAIEEAKRTFASGRMPVINPDEEACKYCPALTSCPYWTNFAKSMLGRMQAIENGPELSELTPEEMGKAWEDAKKAEKIAEMTIKALKLMASKNPFPVGEKYEVRSKEKSRTYFDDGKARGLIVTLMTRAGSEPQEIEQQLEALKGKTTFEEFRAFKKTG